MRKTLFSVVKNEAPFLLEWIAYHRVIGFDQIVIYSNNSDDGTHELLDALASHGILHHTRLDTDRAKSAQGHSAAHFMKSGMLRDGDYAIWLDPDEFLNIKLGSGQVDDLVAGLEGAAGILVARRRFGLSGRKEFAGSLVNPAYLGCQPEVLKHDASVKTFFRVTQHLDRIRVHKPLLKTEFLSSNMRFLNPNGTPMDAMARNALVSTDTESKTGTHSAAKENLSYTIAQINHYQLRSLAGAYIKMRRGCGSINDLDPDDPRRLRYQREFIDRLDQNFAKDDSILRHQVAVGQEQERLEQLPNVGSINAATRARYFAFEKQYLETGTAVLEPLRLPEPVIPAPLRTRRSSNKLVLHIGQMKTGTTTLQRFLQQNSDQLATMGIHYPVGQLVKNAHPELMGLLVDRHVRMPFIDRLSKNSPEAVQTHVEALLDQVRQSFDDNKKATCVLSSEFISARADEVSVPKLKEITETLTDDCTVVAYIRSPIGGLMSRLQQSLVTQTRLRKPQWQLQAKSMVAFKEIFEDRFRLKEFSRSSLLDGDICKDFVVSYLPDVSFDKLTKVAATNVSLSAEAMSVLQNVKLAIRPDGSPVYSDTTIKLTRLLKKNDALIGDYASPMIREELKQPIMRLQKDALRIRTEFGIVFDDLDYDEIGKPCDIDLDSLQFVSAVCDVNTEREQRLIAAVLREASLPPEICKHLTLLQQ